MFQDSLRNVQELFYTTRPPTRTALVKEDFEHTHTHNTTSQRNFNNTDRGPRAGTVYTSIQSSEKGVFYFGRFHLPLPRFFSVLDSDAEEREQCGRQQCLCSCC